MKVDRCWLGVCALPALICGTGCRFQARNDLSLHVLTINETGEAVHPGSDERIKDLDGYLGRIFTNADDLCDRQRLSFKGQTGAPADNVRRLMIHIHGGLNADHTSLRTADDVVESMKGESASEWHYPFFITWPSGGLSTYHDHLFKFRLGEIRHGLWYGAFPLFLLTDLSRGIARAPRSLTYHFVNDTALATKVVTGWNILPSWSDADTLYEATRESETEECVYGVGLGKYRRTKGVQGGRFLAYWLLLPFKIFTQVTALDGMGHGAWNVMLHRIRNLFRKPREFKLRDSDFKPGKLCDHLTSESSGALMQFIAKLREHLRRQRQDGKRYEILLVGHSMGAIAVNEMLRHLPEDGVTDIVYMAPACSIRDAAVTVLPYLETHEQTEFHVLTLHPLAEVDEINACDVVPRGSLLEWIDNWYTSPPSAFDRRLGKWVNILNALHVFRDVRTRFFVKGFGVAWGSIPQRHGQFNDCPFWRSEFRDPSRAYHFFKKEGDWEWRN